MRTFALAWKKRIEGAFAGSFLDSVAGRIVLKLRRGASPCVWCVSATGKALWELEFEQLGLDHYFLWREKLFLDGTAARRVDVETGRIAVERDFRDRVFVAHPIPRGPVYVLGGIVAPKALLGLDPDTLETVWEWPDPEYYAHGDQLCRYVDGMIHTVDLKTMEVRRAKHSRTLGFHGHGGDDVWCHFEDQERFGISTVTGEVVWHHKEREPGLHHNLTFVGDRAYCGGAAISAIDLRTGALLWRRPVSGDAGRFREAEGRLYATTKSGMVYVLDAAAGDVLVSHELKGDEPSAVAPLGPDRVVVGTYKLLYCFEFS